MLFINFFSQKSKIRNGVKDVDLSLGVKLSATNYFIQSLKRQRMIFRIMMQQSSEKSYLKMVTRYVRDDNVSLFINFLYGDTYYYKDKLFSLGFRYSRFSKDFYRVLTDEEKENEFIAQVLSSLDKISYTPFLKRRIDDSIEKLEKMIQEKYNMKLARAQGKFCKADASLNFFLLLKNFHYNIYNQCFSSLPNRFVSRIISSRIDKEILSFDEFLQYNPIITVNDARIYLHLQVFQNYLKNLYVITPSSKDIREFVRENFEYLVESVSQFFVSSFMKRNRFFIFVESLEKDQIKNENNESKKKEK